jgi:hypothetical protein
VDTVSAIIVSRAAEHLLAALIGIFAVYLGYRLFLNMPHRREGESKVELPGGVSIYVSRIGPGIFFAAFGSLLVGYGVSRPVDYRQATTAAVPATATSAATGGSAQMQYSGMMPGGSNAAAPAAAAVAREPVVRALALLAVDVAQTPPGPQRNDRQIALREARVTLMQQAWRGDWGSPEVFTRWVYDEAEQDPPPASVKRAVAVYRGTTQ